MAPNQLPAGPEWATQRIQRKADLGNTPKVVQPTSTAGKDGDKMTCILCARPPRHVTHSLHAPRRGRPAARPAARRPRPRPGRVRVPVGAVPWNPGRAMPAQPAAGPPYVSARATAAILHQRGVGGMKPCEAVAVRGLPWHALRARVRHLRVTATRAHAG
jgi:hypothetical protein